MNKVSEKDMMATFSKVTFIFYKILLNAILIQLQLLGEFGRAMSKTFRANSEIKIKSFNMILKFWVF